MFYLTPANDDHERYLTPRDKYDLAIHDDSGDRCIYDYCLLLQIFISEYIVSLRQTQPYLSEQMIYIVARDHAIQFLMWLQFGCNYYTGPLIKNVDNIIRVY